VHSQARSRASVDIDVQAQADNRTSENTAVKRTDTPTVVNTPAKVKTQFKRDGTHKQSAHCSRLPELPTGLSEWSPDFLRNAQLDDPDICPVIQWLEANYVPTWEEVKGHSPFIRALFRQMDSLTFVNGVLCRVFVELQGKPLYYQVVLATSLRNQFLAAVHCDAAAHFKWGRCKELVQMRAYWYNWQRDLKLFIKCCDKCEGFFRGTPKHQAKLRPTKVGAIGEQYACDLMGPYPPSNGYTFIFTGLDLFSKLLIVAPLRNKESVSVARCIVEKIFLVHGLGLEIRSDRGGEFLAEIAQELWHILGIHHVKTSAMTPNSNGSVERVHRSMHSMLAKCVAENQRDWSYYLQYITFCYNTTPQKSTNFSPFFLTYGRDPFWRIDLCMDNVEREQTTVSEFARQNVERMEYAQRLTREHLGTAMAAQSKWFNRDVRAKEFKINSKVRVHDPRQHQGRTPKWQLSYRNTATVLRKINDAPIL
jgi:hypothetical protein